MGTLCLWQSLPNIVQTLLNDTCSHASHAGTGRITEAGKVLRKAAKINQRIFSQLDFTPQVKSTKKTKLIFDFLFPIQANIAIAPSLSWRDLFRPFPILFRSLAMFFNWFATTMFYNKLNIPYLLDDLIFF